MKRKSTYVVLSVFAIGFVALLFGPVVIAQQDSARSIDPLRYTEAIEAFEEQDLVSPPPTGAIVITGSSSITRWNKAMQKDLAPLTVIPRGFGGSTMQDVLHFIDRLAIAYKPRAIVIYEGDNDTGLYAVPPEKIAGQFETIVKKIHDKLPETRIYVDSVKPSLSRVAVWSKAQKTNVLLQNIVTGNERLTYIDVATPLLGSDGNVMNDIFIDDGLHLNAKGTRIWAATFKAALMKAEARYE